jgi:hypothetical protein
VQRVVLHTPVSGWFLHLPAQRFVSVFYCIFLLTFTVYYCNGLKITWAFRWLGS